MYLRLRHSQGPEDIPAEYFVASPIVYGRVTKAVVNELGTYFRHLVTNAFISDSIPLVIVGREQ